MMIGRLPLLILIAALTNAWAEEQERSYVNCDDGSIPFDTVPSTLAKNKIHQICPGTLPDSVPFGQPICGDGSAYSFLYASPPEVNNKKVILEFMGGGACWNAETCQNNGGLQILPELAAFASGTISCKQASNLAKNVLDFPINLLCDTTIGTTDLSEYNYVVVPYCSQDVHMGDSESNYAEEYGNDGVYHHGGHNLMSVLQWVYTHYPDPSHILVTGCSAGGTILPVVYDLLYQHYNSVERKVNINTIIDSAVYLTPSDFFDFGFPNWNPASLLSEIGFDYDQSSGNEFYSNILWEHIINRGSSQDKWGFLSHTHDPVSISFYIRMGGDAEGYDSIDDAWTSKTVSFLGAITEEYDNVDTFFINGSDHCNFGLYYGLQEAGFDEWAGDIITEQDLSTSSPTPAPTTYCSTIPSKRWCLKRGCAWDRESQTCSTSGPSFCGTIPGKNLCLKNGCDWDKVSKTCS